MPYKYKSYKEIEKLKEQGWKQYLVRPQFFCKKLVLSFFIGDTKHFRQVSVKKGDSDEDFKRHMTHAKDLVIEMKGEIVEDVEIIDGFSVVFPADAATTYKIHAIDHYAFFEQDRDISL
ncbi:hypothetical protein Golomagni_04367 [Golovinomyces magnicellulatus]|nr:hypothetical protein Golomagni_04367 [Golovinomyces magnicellulatus]